MKERYLCVEGKILAIAQYVIKYDYRGNTKGKNQLKIFFVALVDSFYGILLTFFVFSVHFEVVCRMKIIIKKGGKEKCRRIKKI